MPMSEKEDRAFLPMHKCRGTQRERSVGRGKMTTTALSEADMKNLSFLDEYSGTLASTVAAKVSLTEIPTTTDATCSRAEQFQELLRDLEGRGLARHLPNPKPLGCWLRTKAGTEALNAGRAGA